MKQYLRYFGRVLSLFLIIGLLKSTYVGATTYISISSGNWNTTTIWSPNGTPGTAAGDIVTIGDGTTVTLNITPANPLASLTIGQGTSGILMYHNSATAISLTVAGTITINAGAVFQANSSPTVGGTHTLIVGTTATNSITNNGAINFKITSGFTSSVNTTINSTGAYSFGGSGTNTFNDFTQSNTNASGFVLNADMNIVGNLTISASAKLDLGGKTLTLTGNYTNSGTLITGNNNSTLQMTGTTTRNFNIGTTSPTATFLPNLTISNSGGAIVNIQTTSFTVNYLTVNSAATFDLNGLSLTVKNDLINGGSILSNASSGALVMSGTVLQTISGSGTWTSSVAGAVWALTINNSAGVNLNSNLAIRNTLTLTAGALGGTGTLTIGTPSSSVSTIRTAGSLTNVAAFNYTTGIYSITYNATSTNYTVLNELPAAPTLTNGTLTVSTSTTTVTLDKNANIGTLTTSAAGATFNLNGFTLGLSLLTSVNNTGTITANGATSTLKFNGTVAQNFNPGGTFTGNLISNLIIDNSFSTSGLSLQAALTTVSVGALTVNASRFFTLAGFNVNVKNDLDNNGTITSTSVNSTITMNGTSAQQIQSSGGTGVWTTGTAGRLLNLNINNSAGVTLNSNTSFAVQTLLTLTAGTFTATTLTIGIPATAVTVTRLAGSLANAPSFNYTTGAYAINYNSASTNYSVLNELPSSATPTNGVLTVTTSTTTVTLDKNANIGTLITSAAGATFNLNGFTLGLSLLTSVSNTGTITANGATSTLKFNGTVAQNFNPAGTYTGNLISNLVVDNSFSTSGLSLQAALTTVSVGALTVNASRFFTLAGFNVNVKNDLDNNGTITSTSANSTVTMNGTSAQQIQSSGGTGVWTTGTTGRLLNLNINNSAGITLNSNTSFAVQTLLTLTAGTFTATTLTIGIPATAITMTRLAGSLANVPAFNYTTGAYAINYNTAATNYTVLNELPSSATPTNGIMTVSTSTTTVTLDKNANIGRLTNSVAGATCNLNGFTLGLSDATPTSNSGTINASASTSAILLNGTVSQTFTPGTITAPNIANLLVTNTNASGAKMGSANNNFGNITIQSASLFDLVTLSQNVQGSISNNGTFTTTSATISMNGSSAQIISGSGIWQTSAGTGRLNALTMNNTSGVDLQTNLAIQSTLTLTNGTLSTSNGSTLTIGVAATNVAMTRTNGSLSLTPNFGYTTGSYSVTYGNGTAVPAITTGSEIPTTASGFATGPFVINNPSNGVSLNASITIGGNSTLTLTTGAFSIGSNVLTLTGTITVSSGTFIGGATSDIVFQNGASAVSANLTTVIGGLQNLTINKPTVTVSQTGSNTVNGSLTLTAGIFSIGAFTLALNGSLSVTSGTITGGSTSNITIGGTGSNLTLPAIASGLQNLTINRANGATLGAALSLGSTGVLTLTNGLLTTTSTNLLTVGNTAVGGVTGFSSASYVNGPLARTFPTSLASGSTYSFPVGKSLYQLYQMINPTTSSGGTVVITAEVFDGDAGGTAGSGVNTLNTNRYWNAVKSGAGTLTSAGQVSLTETTPVLTSSNVICNSATQAGTYSSIASTVAGNVITSQANASVPVVLGYFVVGTVGTLSGTYTVGASGNFQKLYQVANILNAATVTGNVVFELQSDYDGTTGENFPINFIQYATSGGSWTATIRPATGVTTRTTSGNPGSNVNFISLNGVDNLTFDGRAGGTGSAIGWIIRNTQTAVTFTPAFLFINDATNNVLEYLQIEGQNTSTTSGTILFSTTTGTTGNDNNTISFCSIRDRSDASGTPANGIYASGTSAKENSGVQILSNNIFNFFNTSGSAGVKVTTGNTDWTISGNSFYQTATRAGTATADHYGIFYQNTGAGTTVTIENNFIGGGASGAGGSAWTITGGVLNRFVGIRADIITSGTGNINGNTIQNIVWTATSSSAVLPGIFTGIYTTNGGFNIGTTSANTVGSTTAAGSISITTGTTGANSYGMGHDGSSGTINYSNNQIGGISLLGTTTSMSHNFTGILYSQAGSATTRTISSNTIGSTTVANSINASNVSVSATAQSVIGISMSGGANAVTISGNTIANLNNAYAGTAAGLLTGINSPFAPNTITGNSIYNLSSSSQATGTGSTASVAGIVVSATSASGHTISQNTVHSLTNSAVSATVNIEGIFYNPASGGTNSVDRNLVHSLSLATTSATATINGIMINTGTATIANNMVRLGIKPDGSSITTGYAINGINEVNTTGPNNFYFNSVYIGGSGVVSSSNTFSFLSAVTSGARLIEDNIFWNARSNTSGAGKNYAIKIAATTGLTSNYNDLFANGTGAVLGANGGTDYSNLQAWQQGTTFDANSISADPMFINPTGSNTAVDLHIQPPPAPAPIEGTGINIAGVTLDYDGQTRASFTPVDLGADADNFTASDVTPPTISYTAIPANTSSTASPYVFTPVTITDNSGVNTSSGTKPRLYYKKSGDANDLSGWKFVEATNASSPFSFTFDYTLLNDGGVSASDVIQYFVVAQDLTATPNVAISSGFFNAAPSSVALTSTAFPIGGTINNFSILPTQGTITVGTGGNYPAFTTATGLFNAINSTTLTGNITVNVVSDIAIEDGTNKLNQWAESGAGNYTLTIQSDNGTTRTISGTYIGTATANNGLFRFDGADRVTINGGTGSQRQLVFRNTNTAASNFNATMQLLNDATNNAINNCVIEGATAISAGTNGVIYIGTTTGTIGNDNIIIDRCDIRDLTTASATPVNCIYANGNVTAGKENSNVNITNCNIFNFFLASNDHYGILISSGNTGGTITGNSFYQTASRNVTGASAIEGGLSINNTSGNGFTVQNNFVGGQTASCGGAAWTMTGSGVFLGMRVSIGTTTATSIQGNTIQNISNTTSSASTTHAAIYILNGSINCGNNTANTIGSQSGTGSITFTGSGTAAQLTGILLANGTPGVINISSNTIGGITIAGAGTTIFRGINTQGAPTAALTISGNTIGSSTLANSISNATNQVTSGIVSSSTSSANNFSGNTIMNLSGTAGGTSAQVVGISTSGTGTNTISANTISTLSNANANTGTTSSASVLGISTTSTGIQTITQNSISGLSNSAASGAVVVSGICLNGGAVHVVSRNFAHSFSTSSITAVQHGINMASASAGVTLKNNMVRLGIDASGNSVTTSASIIGILKATSVNSNIYNNSVYIGGSSVAGGTVNTAAFQRTGTATDDIRDNILVNARSNASGTALHYAYILNAITTVTSDYNIYNATGTGGAIASVNGGSASLSLQGLRASLANQDLHSGVGDPSFVNATGNSSAVDLHVNSSTPAEATGINIATVTDDYDGQPRSSFTPVDIGADAGSFDALTASTDVFTPAISYTVLPNQGNCGGPSTVTLTATITDVGTGVPVSGGNVPRIYFRRSAPAPTSWVSNSGTLQTGNGNNGTWSFVIDYSLLALTPVAGETYQYYVVAQDQATNPTNPNIWFSKYDATTPVFTNNDVNNQATAPTTPDSYAIVTTLSGTVYVGTGAGTPSYPTFNGASGLFSALNGGALSGNLTVIVQQTSITEPATVTFLNAVSSCSGGPYTITIQPASATTYTISGTTTTALIGFAGASNVTIDGNFSGSGRWLKFANTSTTSNVIYFKDNSNNITVKNCLLDEAVSSSASAIVNIATCTAAGTGNSFLTFDNNKIGSSSFAVNVVLSNGSAVSPNHDNTFTTNEIFNFLDFSHTTSYGIKITSTGNGGNWNISDNSIYNTGINGQSPQTGLSFLPGSSSNGNIITGNFIGGSSPNCGTGGSVAYWGNSYDNFSCGINEIDVISVNAGTVTISGNTIQRIQNQNSAGSGVVVFTIAGSTLADINNNLVGNSNGVTNDQVFTVGGSDGSFSCFDPGFIYGIKSTTSSTLTVTGNTFYYLAQLGSVDGGYSYGISHTGSGAVNITGNTIIGAQAVSYGLGSLNCYGIYINPSASTSGNIISQNVIDGPYILFSSFTAGYSPANVGIYANGSNLSGTISKNTIYKLANGAYGSGSSPASEGIWLAGSGTWTVANNEISLQNNGSTSPDGLYGIEDNLTSGSTLNCYYNSVLLYGSQSSGGSNSSFTFFRYPGGTGTVAGSTVSLKDNIFINNRTGGGGGVNHYAIANFGTSNFATNWAAGASDNNFLASRSAATLGRWGPTSETFANWKTASAGDANSQNALAVASGNSSSTQVNPSELFVSLSTADFHIVTNPPAAPYPFSFVENMGTSVSPTVTDDIDGVTRSVSTPDIGVDEFVACTSPDFTGLNLDYCSGDGASLLVPNASGGTFSGTGVIVFQSNYYFDPATAGVGGPYDITYTNACGNISYSTTVHDLPSVTLNPFFKICENDPPFNLTGGSPDGGDYSVDNVSATSFNPGTAGAGPHTIKYNYTDDYGCSSFAETTLTVNANPAVNITGNSSLCTGSNTALTANATAGSGSIAGYQWKESGSDISGATNATYTATAAGSYTVEVANSEGCANISSAFAVTENANPATSISGNSSFCSGSSTLLSSNATAGSGTISSYQWKESNVDVSGETNATYTATAAGSYTVRVTNSNGCSTTSSAFVVIVNANPTASISGNSSFCSGGNTLLNSNATAGSGTISSYQWKESNVDIIGETNATYTATAAGSYTVRVTNSNGCSTTSAPFTVTESAYPTVSISGNSSFCTGTNTLLTANATAGSGTISSYQWRKSNIDISGETNSTYTATTAGSYTVRVSNSYGCSATSSAFSVSETSNGTWIGVTSSDWNTASNWCGGVPTSTTDVTIPNGTPFQPDVITVDDYAHHITLANGVTLDIISGTLHVFGNIISNGSINQSGGTISFEGTAPQTIPSLTLGNVTINNAEGITITGDLTINGTLNFTSGTISTGSNTVIISGTGSVSHTDGWVNGNLKRYVPAGSTVVENFDIGDATHYLPVAITFASVTAAGNLTGHTNTGDHPEVSSSHLNTAKSVKSYWTFDKDGTLVFTTYNATFSWPAGYIDPDADAAHFIIGKFD